MSYAVSPASTAPHESPPAAVASCATALPHPLSNVPESAVARSASTIFSHSPTVQHCVPPRTASLVQDFHASPIQSPQEEIDNDEASLQPKAATFDTSEGALGKSTLVVCVQPHALTSSAVVSRTAQTQSHISDGPASPVRTSRRAGPSAAAPVECSVAQNSTTPSEVQFHAAAAMTTVAGSHDEKPHPGASGFSDALEEFRTPAAVELVQPPCLCPTDPPRTPNPASPTNHTMLLSFSHTATQAQEFRSQDPRNVPGASGQRAHDSDKMAAAPCAAHLAVATDGPSQVAPNPQGSIHGQPHSRTRLDASCARDAPVPGVHGSPGMAAAPAARGCSSPAFEALMQAAVSAADAAASAQKALCETFRSSRNVQMLAGISVSAGASPECFPECSPDMAALQRSLHAHGRGLKLDAPGDEARVEQRNTRQVDSARCAHTRNKRPDCIQVPLQRTRSLPVRSRGSRSRNAPSLSHSRPMKQARTASSCASEDDEQLADAAAAARGQKIRIHSISQLFYPSEKIELFQPSPKLPSGSSWIVTWLP
jgi:hypothetical protein